MGTKEWETVTGLVLLSEERHRSWFASPTRAGISSTVFFMNCRTSCSSTPGALRFLPVGGLGSRRARVRRCSLAVWRRTSSSGTWISSTKRRCVKRKRRKLSQVIAELMLGPKYREDEAVLG